jgi:hypothetical protein
MLNKVLTGGHWINSLTFVDCSSALIFVESYFRHGFFFSTGSTAPLGPGLCLSVLWSFLETVGLLGRVISSSQGFYLNTGQHKHRLNRYTHQKSMPCVEFEPTIPASERAETVHALDRSVTVTGGMDFSPRFSAYRMIVPYGTLIAHPRRDSLCWFPFWGTLLVASKLQKA